MQQYGLRSFLKKKNKTKKRKNPLRGKINLDDGERIDSGWRLPILDEG